ncbi:hypothetical protein K2173_022907 [Erythroxylum novogranatense]|uniref:Uncharacterized protein n=1 Tax=Erythroxylum novogranatense TaxID=1862640 RepID=A0AAV8T838_9ROSI|nr:hypothetical protein K2173_022907 [Erythroxylum novogranatense]
MTSAIGWYGPLIDLSAVASHIGGFVQLIVFVHRSTPYKVCAGGEVMRTDIMVGDDTRPFFSVVLWQKRLASNTFPGDVVLLQNVKIRRFGNVVEATSVDCSSVILLIHPFQLLLSKGVDDLLEGCRLGKSGLEKLGNVIRWVQKSGSLLYNNRLCSFEPNKKLPRNWKLPEQTEALNFLSLSEVSHLNNSSGAIFNASIGEIFLPITWRKLDDFQKDWMFISRRIINAEDNTIVEDFICLGCQLCGIPLDSEGRYGMLKPFSCFNSSFLGYSIFIAECLFLSFFRCIIKQKSSSLFCEKSSNHFHVAGLIYRPFMLYVWDESEHLPLLVRNKAAELLFGNISADRVYPCRKGPRDGQYIADPIDGSKQNFTKTVIKEAARSCSAGEDDSIEAKKGEDDSIEAKKGLHHDRDINMHTIWRILLRMLLKQGNTSQLRFKVRVNPDLDAENGKFEMVSVSIPCIADRSTYNTLN